MNIETTTDERILLKAHELFMLYGIRSVSMDEIAAHLGISKKTIYQFYADKDALVEDVILLELEKSKTDCYTSKDASDNSIHEIFLAMDHFHETLTRMNMSIVYDLEKYHPKAYKIMTKYKHEFLFNEIKSNIERGINEGLYREGINVEILANYRIVTIFNVFNPETFPRGKYKLPEIVSEITDNFLYGLTTHKGQKLIEKYKQIRSKQ